MTVTESDLGRYRPYLQFLARVSWNRRLQNKLDPSDVVQQTLLLAYQRIGQFRGTTEEELAGWLRRILANVLLEQQRYFNREKRQFGRDQSMEDVLSESSRRMARFAGRGTSPSENAEFNERALKIAQAMETLSSAQLEVLIMHYWQGLSVPEISRILGRTQAAVGGLVHRGLRALRKELGEF